ncbi:MAG: hypothetical protein Q8P49_01500 [Candidatus Liptonbacteria bacterium]|nr:hypothetical protein [Candidatus Liptonbacteria bacterium]
MKPGLASEKPKNVSETIENTQLFDKLGKLTAAISENRKNLQDPAMKELHSKTAEKDIALRRELEEVCARLEKNGFSATAKQTRKFVAISQ